MLFRVSRVSLDKNIRGDEMRRVTLAPVAGDVFGSAPPEGNISLLLTVEASARFNIGDEFAVSFRERES